MKKLRFLAIMAGVLLVFSSCLDDDGYSLGDMWMSYVTVNPLDEKTQSYDFTTDGGSKLWISASSVYYKPKENQRAQIFYTILGDADKNSDYDYYIKLNIIQEYLTKNIAENLNDDNDSIYGADPVKMNKIWIGDNYLNMHFTTYYGGTKKHYINLIQTDENQPYILEFRHNAYDDPAAVAMDGLVAFNLDALPDTGGEEVELEIHTKTYEGDKVYKVKYNSSVKESAEYSSTEAIPMPDIE